MNNIPFNKGHFEWNSQTNDLEFISEHSLDQTDRKKRHRGGYNGPVIQKLTFNKEKQTPSKTGRATITSAGNRHGHGQRLSPRLGLFRNENSTVSFNDVKMVALSELMREREDSASQVSPSFKALEHTNSFNNFLVTLLKYFNCFFERLEQEKRPHKTSYLEPSKAELKAMAETQKRMAGTKRHLGQAYCVLLLGIGLEKQHHMGCGKQRVSSSHRDKKMFEDLYAFCTMFVYITFRRREHDRIRLEVGDMLRSPIYNPAMRRRRHVRSDSESAKQHKPYVKNPQKPISERVEELLAVKLPKVEKLTPAQHRRQFGKRPAIMKAIHQRSSALVSLLPNPREQSDYLFNTTAAKEDDVQGSDDDDDLAENDVTLSELQQEYYTLDKIGIIGEPMDLFNPENLMPKNMENEDDIDSRDEDSPMRNESQQSERPQNKLNRLSRATTEDSIPL